MDQLAGLRIHSRTKMPETARRLRRPGGKTFVWAIASGKGGVGKTLFASTAAFLLAGAGRRVLLVDGEFNLPSVHHFFEVKNSPTREAFLSGNIHLDQALTHVTRDLHLFAPTNPDETAGDYAQTFIERLLAAAAGGYDLILFDVANGFTSFHRKLVEVANEITVVSTPAPAVIANSYALIKLIKGVSRSLPVSVVMNRVLDEKEAAESFVKLEAIVSHFLHDTVAWRGWLTEDVSMAKLLSDGLLLTQWPSTVPFVTQARGIIAQLVLSPHHVPEAVAATTATFSSR